MRGDGGPIEVVARRADLLELLAEKPLHKRDVIDTLDVSRSTVDRAIDELADGGLVERTDDGFETTLAGRLSLERYRRYVEASSGILSAADVLGALPPDADVGAALLADAEVYRIDDAAPYRPLEHLHEAIEAAETYCGVLPALDDARHVRLLYEHAVVEDGGGVLVVAPPVATTIREEFPRRLEGLLEADTFGVHVGETPSFGLVLTEGDGRATVSLVAFDAEGVVRGVVQNGDPEAVSWAESAVERYREDAEPGLRRMLGDGSAMSDGAAAAGSPRSGGDRQPAALAPAGFVHLDTDYFAEHGTADPGTAYRVGLDLPEVHAGYAVERTCEVDGQRRELAADLLSRLREGDDVALLGPPGCGKSTTCKQVACRWYDSDEGPVLYRESGRGRPFEDPAELVRAVDDADGRTLVVVEDAVRPEASQVFPAAAEMADRNDVAVLVDARRNEWQDPPGGGPSEAHASVRTNQFETVSMPSLSTRDRERLLERVEATAGDGVELSLDAAEDLPDTGDGGSTGDLLLVLHHVTGRVGGVDGDEPTSLEADARAVARSLRADEVALDVAITVNLLNAAGFPVAPGLVGSLGRRHDDERVRTALEALAGRLVFEQASDDTYRTVHETWSAAFLAELASVLDEDAAAERFGRCATALLSLADDDTLRRHAREVAPDGGASHLSAVSDAPGEWADDAVERLFALGERYPKLAPLFGDPGEPPLELPAACSEGAALRARFSHARAAAVWGAPATAVRACEWVRDRIEPPGAGAAGARERAELWVAATVHLADVAEEYEEVDREAADLADAALGGGRELGEDRLVARALIIRGRIEHHRGDPEAAATTFERALEAARAGDARLAETDALLELGHNATVTHDHEAAIEYKREALSLSRELGARERENRAAGDLGMDYFDVGSVDEAAEWWQRSLEIARDIGDRGAEASNLQNLGMAELRRGNFAAARERFETGIELKRSLGQDPSAPLLNLSKVHQQTERFDQAVECAERAVEHAKENGRERNVLAARTSLAFVAMERGDLDEAARLARENVAHSTELEDLGHELTNRRLLGVVARERGHLAAAERLLARSREQSRTVGSGYSVGWAEHELGRLERERGDHAAAARRFAAAVDQLRDVGATREAVETLEELVDARAAAGEPARARERCEAAIELAGAADFPSLVEDLRERRAEFPASGN